MHFRGSEGLQGGPHLVRIDPDDVTRFLRPHRGQHWPIRLRRPARLLEQRHLLDPGAQHMAVDGPHDLAGPHLVDGVVDHHHNHAERDRREQQGQGGAEDRAVDAARRDQADQDEDRKADEEAEVELVHAPHQELVGDLRGECGRALLQRDEEQRERNGCDRDDAGGDGGQERRQRLAVPKHRAEPGEACRDAPLRPGRVGPIDDHGQDGHLRPTLIGAVGPMPNQGGVMRWRSCGGRALI